MKKNPTNYMHEVVCSMTEIIKVISDLGQYKLCGGCLEQVLRPNLLNIVASGHVGQIAAQYKLIIKYDGGHRKWPLRAGGRLVQEAT